MASNEQAAMEELQTLQRKLGKKQTFEEAVSSISSILREHFPASSPPLRASIYSAVCRVATVLQTRYTAPGFWIAGLKLFEEAEQMFVVPSEKEHLRKCISRSREQLQELENEGPDSNGRQADNRYLFEGHLTVGPEPPPPAWLVAQNLHLATMAMSPDLNSAPGSSRTREENTDAAESNDLPGLLDSIREMISNMQDAGGLLDLDNAIEASLQEISTAGAQKPPPASKEVVANLPIITVTEGVLARLGDETECAVCRENLVVGDEMQELPCKHLFHTTCLKPWLDEHNSCPICRHELRTDDHAYESKKEREKELDEERKGAANAVRGGEFMYV